LTPKTKQSDDFTRFLVNGVSFEGPDVPVLLQILSGQKNASELLPKGSIYLVEGNKSVEVSIPAGAPGAPVSVQSTTEPLIPVPVCLTR